jgi:HD superfamily phosphodiesterase
MQNIKTTFLDCLELLGKNLEIGSDRYKHSLGVANKVTKIMFSTNYYTNKNFINLCIQSAILHDIGYGSNINHNNFHPVDGYLYLKEQGWDRDICLLVLHHSFSEASAEYSRQDLIQYYNENELSSIQSEALMVLSYSDILTASNGEETTILSRYENIKERYGESSNVYKFMESIYESNIEIIKKMSAIINYDKKIQL